MPRVPPPPRWSSDALERCIDLNGGLFWLDDSHPPSTYDMFLRLANDMDEYAAFAERHLYTRSSRRISHGMLNGTCLNGLAWASPDDEDSPFDFVGVNVGVVFTLLNMFGHILADPRSFPDVGDSALEEEPTCLLPALTTDFLRSGIQGAAPRDRTRRRFAGELSRAGLSVIFFHEVTHLLRGHVELLQSGLVHDNLTRQTLEWDADHGAVIHALNRTVDLRHRLAVGLAVDDPSARMALEAAYGTESASMRTVVYAASMIHRLFDQAFWDIDAQKQATHPDSVVRLTWTIPALATAVFPDLGLGFREWATEMSTVIAAVESDCARARGACPDPRGLLGTYGDPASSDYIDLLRGRWSEIRPLLDPHKRGDSLPL